VLAFRWRGDFNELRAAWIAGSAYARATDGMVFDDQEGKVRSAAEASEVARVEYEAPDPDVGSAVDKVLRDLKLGPYSETWASIRELGGMPKIGERPLFAKQLFTKDYDPGQPRVPAGNSDGGQWTSESGSGATDSTGESEAKPNGISNSGKQYAAVDTGARTDATASESDVQVAAGTGRSGYGSHWRRKEKLKQRERIQYLKQLSRLKIRGRPFFAWD
jgi:hypothetical protein